MYNIDIEILDNHIHAAVTGRECLENSISYWKDIAKVCAETGLRLILVEDYLEGDIPDLDVHTFGKYFAEKTGIPLGAKIASFSKPEKLPVQQYAETVALNWSGVNVRVFTDLDLAREWLFADN